MNQLMSPWLIRSDTHLTILTELFSAVVNPSNSLMGGQQDGNAGYTVYGKTAVVDVIGPILKRPGFISALFSLPTYKEIQKTASKLASDNSIDTVVFNIDSPGGVASGCQETVQAIRELSKSKKTIAFIDGMGTSAAYWLASACNKVYATPSSEVGSVGAILFRPEYANPDKNGNSVAVFASGEQKKDFVGYVKLSDEIAIRLQEYVDNIGSMFVDNVIQLRGLSEEAANVIANAGVFTAEEALKIGLVDGIKNSQEFGFLDIGESYMNGGDTVMEASENNVVDAGVTVEETQPPQDVNLVQPSIESEPPPIVPEESVPKAQADEVEALRREIYELKVVQPFMSDVRALGISDEAELGSFEKLVRLDDEVARELLAVFKKRLSVVTSKVKISVENKSDDMVIRLPIPGMNKEVNHV